MSDFSGCVSGLRELLLGSVERSLETPGDPVESLKYVRLCEGIVGVLNGLKVYESSVEEVERVSVEYVAAEEGVEGAVGV